MLISGFERENRERDAYIPYKCRGLKGGIHRETRLGFEFCGCRPLNNCSVGQNMNLSGRSLVRHSEVGLLHSVLSGLEQTHMRRRMVTPSEHILSGCFCPGFPNSMICQAKTSCRVTCHSRSRGSWLAGALSEDLGVPTRSTQKGMP